MASLPKGEIGSYGAVLLKPWKPLAGDWRVGETVPVGTLIPGEVVQTWPLPNRMAMERTNFVTFFQSPEEAEEAFARAPAVQARAQENPRRVALEADAAKTQARRDSLARARAAKAQRRAEALRLAETLNAEHAGAPALA